MVNRDGMRSSGETTAEGGKSTRVNSGGMGGWDADGIQRA